MTDELDSVPGLPRDTDGPVFREPAEATVFALAVRLHQQGLFTWQEWSDTLATQIAAAPQAGNPDADTTETGDAYYQHWTRALEQLVARKQAVTTEELDQRTDRWRRAYLNTPHGQPIELSAAD